jgi:rSAM/selenodomain-associated transferase 1
VANRITDSLAKSANPEHADRVLGLFAKVWDAGKVKTRLAATLGDATAAHVYLEMRVLHLLRFANTSDQRAVVYSPATKQSRTRFEEMIGRLKPHPVWGLVPQVESDLGTRMSRFVEQQFAAGAKRVVVIGSDAPQLTRDLVDEAFETLKNNDVVFGPSNDGGYYLVGLSKVAEQIFQGIDWSTEKVLQQSLAICESSGLSVAQLETLTDIDNEEDLMQELDLLESSNDLLVEQVFLPNVAEILKKAKS